MRSTTTSASGSRRGSSPDAATSARAGARTPHGRADRVQPSLQRLPEEAVADDEDTAPVEIVDVAQ